MNNTYCDGMWARFLSSQCLRDDFKSSPKSNDLKDIFNFASSLVENVEDFEQRFPVITHIDLYGHTAIDGYSYIRLVKNELPEIRKLAEEGREADIVKQIDDLMRFIELGVNNVDGDAILLIFDGM
ncbi:hypothetical protein LRM41_03605 [Candidatus Nanosynbacter sp. TM7-087]|uniref:hypothetical protein n=1 Tax=Candidatus Nanosynbacter sp. TM7-087 TaxID=2902631 RepID=UPI001FB804B7|nr:hypothetical protein [Candidatus Nanosynbacter sp. TM7-087]MCJ1966637.1 hypothetical protein [Candidatus Nanosynbacter sp. TM7-087]